jgi:hypothetical protein
MFNVLPRAGRANPLAEDGTGLEASVENKRIFIAEPFFSIVALVNRLL